MFFCCTDKEKKKDIPKRVLIGFRIWDGSRTGTKIFLNFCRLKRIRDVIFDRDFEGYKLGLIFAAKYQKFQKFKNNFGPKQGSEDANLNDTLATDTRCGK